MEPKENSLEIGYKEICMNSFQEVVEALGEHNNRNESKFCIVDVDGTLFESNFLKLPLVCHLKSPTISDETRSSFCSLISEVFSDNNIVVGTNRNNFERLLWNSDKVLDSVKQICDIPIVTALNRQVPGFFKKPSEEISSRIIDYAKNKNSLNLYSIEDESIVSPNRDRFLKYIAKRVENELGIEVNIVNYVIRR